MVDPAIVDIIRRYLQKMAERGLPVRRAILFGSQASGGAKRESDIDLVLISPIFDALTWEQECAAWEIAKSVDWRLEPVLCGETVFQRDDWHPLIDLLRREGLPITL